MSGGAVNVDRPTDDRPDAGRLNVDRAVLRLAGVMVLLSVALVALVSPWCLLLTGFVGLNLLQSSFTGFCPAAIIFRKLGLPAGCALP